jgi:hypothetical protein
LGQLPWIDGNDAASARGESHSKNAEGYGGFESTNAVPADFVLAGIGVVPATKFFKKTPLEIKDGIR